MKRELHTSGAVTLKDLGGAGGRTIDSLGCTTAETEAVAALTRSWTYLQNAASGIQETLAYDVTPLTSLAVALGGKERRRRAQEALAGVPSPGRWCARPR